MNFCVNQIINDVTIIKTKIVGNKNYDKLIVKCNKCGRIRTIGVRNLVRGSSKTTFHKYCANQIKDYPKEFYSSWANMKTRTTNDNYEKCDNYKNRGINSNEFEFFIDFYDTMYESYLKHLEKYGIHNTTLERIDVNKSYTKDNCTWTTWYKQAGNKTTTIKFKAISPSKEEFVSSNLKQFCEKHNLNYQTIVANMIKHRHQNIPTTKFRNSWTFIECND